jgi:hypothetical protein
MVIILCYISLSLTIVNFVSNMEYSQTTECSLFSKCKKAIPVKVKQSHPATAIQTTRGRGYISPTHS